MVRLIAVAGRRAIGLLRMGARYAGGMNRLLDGAMPGANLHRAHRLAPRKMLLPSEGCNCPSVALGDNPNGRTLRAQRYAHDVLDDLNAYAVGWTDWNLLLDHTGGPNHLGNVCDAPIVVNEVRRGSRERRPERRRARTSEGARVTIGCAARGSARVQRAREERESAPRARVRRRATPRRQVATPTLAACPRPADRVRLSGGRRRDRAAVLLRARPLRQVPAARLAADRRVRRGDRLLPARAERRAAPVVRAGARPVVVIIVAPRVRSFRARVRLVVSTNGVAPNGWVLHSFSHRACARPRAQPGFSAALWHCEGSARQVWSLTERGQLALNDLIASDGERDTNVDQETEPLCLSKAADPGLGGLTLVPCSGVNASLWLTLDETYAPASSALAVYIWPLYSALCEATRS